MYQVDEVKQAQLLERIKMFNGAVGVEQTWKAMSCQERLSHAIHVDRIKIFPNATSIIEKTKRKHIQESWEERVKDKHINNEYALPENSQHEVHDWKVTHEEK